jgi:Ni,Fe-hydrogenase III large subunit
MQAYNSMTELHMLSTPKHYGTDEPIHVFLDLSGEQNPQLDIDLAVSVVKHIPKYRASKLFGFLQATH